MTRDPHTEKKIESITGGRVTAVLLAALLVLSVVALSVSFTVEPATAHEYTESGSDTYNEVWTEDAEGGDSSVYEFYRGQRQIDLEFTNADSYSGSNSILIDNGGYPGDGSGTEGSKIAPVGRSANDPTLNFAHNTSTFVDGNPDFEGRTEFQVDVLLEDGTSETIQYRVATVDADPSTDAANLTFVVDSHNTMSWSEVTRNLNSDLSSGGYANVEAIQFVRFWINMPGTGGGTDELAVNYDGISIDNLQPLDDVGDMDESYADGSVGRWDEYETGGVGDYIGIGRASMVDYDSDYSHVMVDENESKLGAQRTDIGNTNSLNWRYLGSAGGQGTTSVFNSQDESVITIRRDNSGTSPVWTASNGSSTVDLGPAESGIWHAIETDIDYVSETYDVYLNGNLAAEGLDFRNTVSDVGGVRITEIDDNGIGYWDTWQWSAVETSTGSVTDQNGNPIDDATVTFREVGTGSETEAQTGSTGNFAIPVESGRYEIEISADGYQTLTETRDVEEGDELGTFQLDTQQLDLQFNRFVEPGDSTPYTVEFTGENGTAMDVTGDVTLNSSNVTIATVDTNETEIVGASGVNGTAEITANYTVGNETYTDTRTVTVATKTVDNLEIIPGTWRFSALLDDITIQVILVAIGAAIVATRAASSWAGLGAMELVVIIGWFADWVPLGIMLLGLFTALFIGLNLAANIDYSVRRS